MIRHRSALYFTIGFGVMLAAGWVGFPHVLYKSAAQPLNFNHLVHKDKASQKCSDCHSINSDGVFAGTPTLANCSGCHAEPMGTSANEKTLVVAFVKPGREIPWRSYARQPMNVRFPHAVHVNLGKLTCEKCHGAHGETTGIALYEEDRISGYSRNIAGMTMSDCEDCHRQRGVAAGCLGCHK